MGRGYWLPEGTVLVVAREQQVCAVSEGRLGRVAERERQKEKEREREILRVGGGGSSRTHWQVKQEGRRWKRGIRLVSPGGALG